MNQYLMYVLIGLGILLVCLIIPGLKVLAEALLKLLMDFTIELVKHKGTFLIWGIKTMVSDHVRLMVHAMKPRDEIDPTQRIRRKAKGYED
jgi:hypothetical protein